MQVTKQHGVNTGGLVKSHAVVVGGGLIGVCQAYALAQRGWDVTVLERRSQVAMETSYANAGRFAASSLQRGPVANPSWSAVQSAFRELLAPTTDVSPALVRWGAHFLRNCLPGRHEHNVSMTQWLLGRSEQETERILAEVPGLAEATSVKRGAVYLMDASNNRPPVDGFELRLSCAECKKEFPALAHHPLLTHCLKLTRDFTVDAHQFTAGVAGHCASKHGVHFQFGVTAVGLDFVDAAPAPTARARAGCPDGRAATHVQVTDAQGRELPAIQADAVVLCPGPSACAVGRSWLGGLWLPVQAMRGCSAELYGCSGVVPTVGFHDMGSGFDYQITPFAAAAGGSGGASAGAGVVGPRCRVIGFAEWAGDECAGGTHNTPAAKDHKARLLAHTAKLFPSLSWTSSSALWYGARPMTPDGLPILGRAPGHRNVFVNCGHGFLGWTLCAGSASIVADLMEAKTSDDSRARHLSPARFGCWDELFTRNAAPSAHQN
jgi:D-amino-acid dehydrogenase